MSKKICVWGDSITEGYYDNRGGWTDRLKRYFWKKDDENCSGFFNLGVSGDNTNDLLRRIETEWQARQPELTIFAIGINDAQFLKDKNRQRVSMGTFEENLNKLIKIVSKNSENIVFIGLTKVIENKVTPIPWSPTKHYKNDKIKKYDKIIQQVAQQNNIPFCPMYDLLTDEDLFDGLHPNSQGHQKMFERIKTFLEEEIL